MTHNCLSVVFYILYCPVLLCDQFCKGTGKAFVESNLAQSFTTMLPGDFLSATCRQTRGRYQRLGRDRRSTGETTRSQRRPDAIVPWMCAAETAFGQRLPGKNQAQ